MQRGLDLRKTKPRVFLWSESRLCPEDEVRVIGVAREAISSDGSAGGYRQAPRMWTFGPAPDAPLMVVIGEPETIVGELSQSPWELPDRFRPRPQPVTAEDEDEGDIFD
jgi:hypothetical protein